MEQQSRLHHLMVAINRWREAPRCNQRVIASEVVNVAIKTGLLKQLEDEGITFRFTDDCYEDQRLNAKKIFRWFGQFEEASVQLDTLFCAEQAIVAAMPEDIRLSYLNSIYSIADVIVCPKPKATTTNESKQEIISSSVKESAEAHVALLSLGDNPTKNQILSAHKEASESAIASTNAVGYLEATYPIVILKNSSLKAVS